MDLDGSVEDEEGCLSFPGLFQKVRRAKTLKVQAYNLNGEKVEKVITGLEARAWQHEIDHLNGVLFIDKMGALARLASRGEVQKFERAYQRAQERGDIPPNAEIEKVLAEHVPLVLAILAQLPYIQPIQFATQLEALDDERSWGIQLQPVLEPEQRGFALQA